MKFTVAERLDLMNSIEIQLDQILEEYSDKIEAAIEKTTKEIAAETVKELKSNSPVSPSGGTYAKGWSKKKSGRGIVVYNKSYQLTHLLEHGHVSANQYGTYSKRVPAIPHIAPVEKKMNEKYLQELRKEIDR